MNPGFHLCLNCNAPTKGKYNYQGVILCSHCNSLAIMCDKRAVDQCQNLLTVYRESLRVSLASGKLRPSTNIPDRSKRIGLPTHEDLRALLNKIATIKGEAGEAAGASDGCGDGGEGDGRSDDGGDPVRP